eukprot:80201-Amphidinium_carterae.1
MRGSGVLKFRGLSQLRGFSQLDVADSRHSDVQSKRRLDGARLVASLGCSYIPAAPCCPESTCTLQRPQAEITGFLVCGFESYM